MTEEEIFTWVGERQQELLDLSPKIRMRLEDCLGQFVRIDGKHYIVTLGSEDIFNKGLQSRDTYNMKTDNKKIIDKALALILAVCFMLVLVWTTMPVYMIKSMCALFMLKFLFEALD